MSHWINILKRMITDFNVTKETQCFDLSSVQKGSDRSSGLGIYSTSIWRWNQIEKYMFMHMMRIQLRTVSSTSVSSFLPRLPSLVRYILIIIVCRDDMLRRSWFADSHHHQKHSTSEIVVKHQVLHSKKAV